MLLNVGNFKVIFMDFYWYSTVERRLENFGRREGSRIGKGPQGVNRTLSVTERAVVLYVNALTMRLSVPTSVGNFK